MSMDSAAMDLSKVFDHAQGEIIIPLDGDGQNDPADIPKLIEKMAEGYDVVSGWRKDRQDAFLSRKLPSQLANALISYATGIHLHDYGCSLKAYRRSIISNIQIYGEMHRFLPAWCAWQGGRVAEIPVNHHPRTRGKSKYGLMRIGKVIIDLLTVKFFSGYLAKPNYLFSAVR
jgi:glycosyltransferase involved in cell wall biosynthesis